MTAETLTQIGWSDKGDRGRPGENAIREAAASSLGRIGGIHV